MRKSLLTALGVFAAATIFVNSTGTVRAEEDHLKKPHEQVQKYLDEYGVAKEEFRVKHYFFIDENEVLHYNRIYNFKGRQFTEQYDINKNVISHKNGESHILFPYPSMIFWRGTWYIDPFRDGFNGNEVIMERRTVEEPKPKKTVRCDPRNNAFCI